MRLADAFETAPSTVTPTNLRAPSPSFTTMWASSVRIEASAFLKPESRRSPAASMRGAPRLAAAWVAKSSSVSEVEVSLSTVMALKLSFTLADSMAWSADAAIGASVKT